MADATTWVREQVAPLLAAGEEVQLVGYLLDSSAGKLFGAWRAKAYWAALTPGRLFLIHCRRGAFRPILENNGVDTHQRSDIIGVVHRGRQLVIVLVGGRQLSFEAGPRVSQAPQQALLLEMLAQQHPAPPEIAGTVKRRIRVRLIAGIVIAALGIGYGAYRYFHGGRVEARVDCRVAPPGILCTLRRLSGAAAAKACWKVEVQCANGVRVATRPCALVPDEGTTVDVGLQESDFPNLDQCDKPDKLVVDNLVLDRP